MTFLNFQEHVFLVHEVQHQPGGGKITDFENDHSQCFRDKSRNPAEEEIADLLKVNESLRQVDGDRIHADYLEEYDTFSPAFYIDEIIENGENSQGLRGRGKDESTGPQILDDRKPDGPQCCRNPSDDSRAE